MGKRITDIIGIKKNRLTIIAEAPKVGNKNRRVIVKCDCGKTKNIFLSTVINGYSKSCGCLQKEVAAEKQTKHGFSKTKLDTLLSGMIKRCYNSKCKAFKNYGGRGIVVCEEWKINRLSFFEWAKLNGYKEGLQIDRIDVNGDYDPSNCRFVDRHTNMMNRRITVWLEYNGINKTMFDWAKTTGIKYKTLKDRICKLKWSTERALSTPIKIKI